MKKTLLFTLALGAISLVSCVKENPELNKPVVEGTPFSITAVAPNTKTAVNNAQTGVEWVENDAMNVFHAPAGSTFYVSDGEFTLTDGNNFDGTIEGELSASNDWYAFYPYTSYITTPANTSAGYVTVGSAHNAKQTQVGNDNMKHLAGNNIPLYGVLTGVAENATPKFTMEQAVSVVAINVTNNSGEDLTVTSVSFKGTEDIVGTYYINFVDPNNVVYTKSGDSYVSSTANLTVDGGPAIENAASAVFYIAIKPFTAPSGQKLTVSVNGYEKDIDLTKDVAFTHGKIKTINFNYDNVVEDPIYTLSFTKLTSGTNYNTYTAAHDVDCCGITWSVFGNQSIGDYIRMGGKNTTATDRTLTAQKQLAAIVNKVVVNHSGIGNGSNSSITINSVSLKVSNTTSFSSPIETVTINNPSVSSSGQFVFEPSSSSSWDSGKYYQFVVNFQITGTNNCYLIIDNVCFYGEAADIPVATLSSIVVKTAPKVLYTEGDNFNPAGLVITKTMSDASTEDIAYSGHESEFTFSPSLSTALTTSNDKVTISYGGKSVDQTITVREAGGLTPTDHVITFSTVATNNSWGNGIAQTDFTVDGVHFVVTGEGNNGKYYTSDSTWRMYNGGGITLSVEGGTITAVTSNPTQTFTIKDGKASLSFSATVKFKSITVTY